MLLNGHYDHYNLISGIFISDIYRDDESSEAFIINIAQSFPEDVNRNRIALSPAAEILSLASNQDINIFMTF